LVFGRGELWNLSILIFFNRQWKELHLDDNALRELEMFLCEKPDRGDVIQGTGGLRKTRWAVPGKEKRGGARVIYLLVWNDFIYMITAYGKGEKDDLTPAEKKIMKQLADRIKGQ
jgi:hypothetical protein